MLSVRQYICYDICYVPRYISVYVPLFIFAGQLYFIYFYCHLATSYRYLDLKFEVELSQQTLRGVTDIRYLQKTQWDMSFKLIWLVLMMEKANLFSTSFKGDHNVYGFPCSWQSLFLLLFTIEVAGQVPQTRKTTDQNKTKQLPQKTMNNSRIEQTKDSSTQKNRLSVYTRA